MCILLVNIDDTGSNDLCHHAKEIIFLKFSLALLSPRKKLAYKISHAKMIRDKYMFDINHNVPTI